MNSYNDYAAFTDTTAIYPDQVAAPYLALGICSEASECVELRAKRLINPVQYGNTVGKEVGDVQWYVARLARTYGFDFSDLVLAAKRGYQPMFGANIDDILESISVEAGLIAGKVKKQLRDGGGWNGEQREEARQYIRARLIKIIMASMSVGDWMYANHCAEYNSYDKILTMNRKKLEGRVERGTLSGSGDNR